jgi:uncharacterized YigZ family protein
MEPPVPKRYMIPASDLRLEETIRKSRFIVSVSHVSTASAAGEWIQTIKKTFNDASHNCWAYIAGPPTETNAIRSSDDGEPSGTAGRPMLNILLRSGLGETATVVTRYFGGIKLGTGGLVRAYAGMVQKAMAAIPLIEKTTLIRLSITIAYPYISALKRLAGICGAVIRDERYTENALLVLELPADAQKQFEASLVALTKGDIDISRETPK